MWKITLPSILILLQPKGNVTNVISYRTFGEVLGLLL